MLLFNAWFFSASLCPCGEWLRTDTTLCRRSFRHNSKWRRWRGGFACTEHCLQSSWLGRRHQLRGDSPRGPHASCKSFASGRINTRAGFAQEVVGYAAWCAEGLWPSGKSAIWILGYAQFVGAEPRVHYEPERKRRALPHIRRHSRVSWITF